MVSENRKIKTDLVEAVERFAQRISTPLTEVVILNFQPDFQLTTGKSHLIYRVLQELIGNALKHAQCSSVFVKFERQDNWLIIQVEDDGSGMSENQIETGLHSIKERVSALSGTVAIQSSEGMGTTVKIQIEIG